ncbi:MAG TPA: serine hydrolase domain-containing protein [Bradyrhizobium sp.]|nr:serine hydrolase domain-containing protein [Bradyrhizobium sp.]
MDQATTDLATAEPRQHLPDADDFLLWPPCLQAYGYRIVEKLFATRAIRHGEHASPIPRGRELTLTYRSDGEERTVAQLMDRNAIAGLLVIRDGRIVLERYGLGLQPGDRWSTMSMVKSMTAMLVGAAIAEGFLKSVDERVTDHLPQLGGSAYDGVTIRHLLTMSSGVAWLEDYADRSSHVNQYSRLLAAKTPGGVLDLLKTLSRAHPPGTVWSYNTGDTYLLGAVLTAATRTTLADTMTRTIWQPCGMEFDGYYTLDAENGQEIAGSRAGMALRDLGRIGLLIANDGMAGHRILPAGWVDAMAARAFDLPVDAANEHRLALGLTGYGFSWWLRDDGAMLAMGHSGQRLYVNRARKTVVVNLAAYPEPRYRAASEHNRDAELLALIDAVLATAG